METHTELVARFLEFACWDHHVHGKGDHRMYDRAAQRLLTQHPEIQRDSIYTAIVCGDLAEVERIIAATPAAASEPGGSRGWTPLLYLCYTRFSNPPTIDNAVAIARSLLSNGANPNDFYIAGDVRYSALTGVAGEGEQDSPRQPNAGALFQLLLEHGAEPFDQQVLYNTHFSGDVLWWLKLIHAHTMKTEQRTAWDDPEWSMLDMGGYGSGARFLLWVAMEKNDLNLAAWLLEHGANPNSAPAADRRLPKRTLYEEASLRGFTEMADLLIRYGAIPSTPELNDEDSFLAACFRLDRKSAEALIVQHPEYLQTTRAMFAAAHQDRADVVDLLLDLGVPLEVHDQHNTHTLHHAAAHNSRNVVKLLIARGAQIDPRETCWGATPIGWAAHGDKLEMIDYLSQYSRNVWTLAFRGYVDRLREVLSAEPELAEVRDNDGITPLWWLPDDEEKALAIVDLLIAHGANPAATNKAGRTAADWANKRAMIEVAARLKEAAAAFPDTDEAVGSKSPGQRMQQYEELARDLVVAYETGYEPALKRFCEHYGRSLGWEELRAAVQGRMRSMPESEKIADGMYEGYFALPHAQLLIARQEGFANWAELQKSIEGNPH
jgi:ankyrin repeat protein